MVILHKILVPAKRIELSLAKGFHKKTAVITMHLGFD
jgi:hypothetical protein